MEETIALDSIQAIAASFGASFDAEKIVDSVVEKDGTQYYKVRWVKYSWEPAASFAHLEHLIRDFWSQFGGIPDNIQDLTTNRDDSNRAGAKPLSDQIISREGAVESNQNISSTMLNPVSTIVDDTNVQDTHVDENHPLQERTSFSDNESDVNSSLQLPQTDDKPQEEEHTIHSSTTNIGKKSQLCEPKKRRKIPGSCTICGKQFKSTTNIAAHRKLHTEERQYECNECGRKFRRKLHLVRHKESHAGIKSYVCNICGNNFSSKWYMQAHAVIHSGDKPYKCDVCQKCFNNKANLNKHKLTHENNRPFVCNQCGRTYRQSYDLKRHMSTHSAVKKFSCTYCDRSFTMKSYLQRHLLTHVGEKKFMCEMCPAKFFQRGHLNHHIRQHHEKTDHQVDSNGETSFNSEKNDDDHQVSKEHENLMNTVNDKLSGQTNDIVDEEVEFFASQNNNRSIVFIPANNPEFDNRTSQIVTSKDIYHEAFTTSHNISMAVNSAIPQKCLIIDANQLIEKRSLVLDNCLDDSTENRICLENEIENKVHSETEIIRQNVDGQNEGNISSDTVCMESLQSNQEVALSVLTSDHAENYFTEQGVLQLQKDAHIYLQ